MLNRYASLYSSVKLMVAEIVWRKAKFKIFGNFLRTKKIQIRKNQLSHPDYYYYATNCSTFLLQFKL